MKNTQLNYAVDYSQQEPEFWMQIPFETLEDIRLSIAHRKLSNRGSGVIANSKKYPISTRIIGGRVLEASNTEDSIDARIYHDSYEEHIERLLFRKSGKHFVMISNGNLGGNYWHIAWEKDKDKRLYCLEKEPFTSRLYSCFTVPENGLPRISNFRFNGAEDILDENGKPLQGILWCNFGQQIVKNGKRIPLEDIIEQFCDARHIFDLKDRGETAEKDKETLNDLYEGYPESFRGKMLNLLASGFSRGRHYQATLGIDENGIVIYHFKGTIEEVADRLVDKKVKDAIVLDQGGSVGAYASWPYPNGGFLSTCSYFMPNRISTIAFVLK